MDASREIRSSIVFATAIVMLVFSPLFFLSGVEGRLLQPLGFAYLISLFASLIVALTVTPALCAYLLPGVRSILEAREPALAAALKRSYERVLPHVLRHATPVILAASLLLALAVATIPFMGRAFLPAFNEGALVISAVTLPGTSLEESNVLGSAIERLLLDVPEVEATARRTGRAELDEHVQGVESAEIDVRIAPGGRPRDALLEDIRERLSLIPGTNITIGQPISHRIDHMLSGSRANVAIKVFGEDLVVLRTVGNQLVAAVQDVPGLVDLSLEPQADIPTVRVGFGRTALKRIPLVRSTQSWYSCGAGGGHGRVLDRSTTPGAARCGRGVAVGRARREVLRQSRVGRSAEAASARNRRGGASQANPLAHADPPRPAHGAGGPDPRAAGSHAGRMTGGSAHAGESPHAVPHDQTARLPV